MKLLSKSILLLLSVGILFTACNKDDQINTIVPENPNYTPDTTIVNGLISALKPGSSGGLDLGCMRIGYPFGLVLKSGNTVDIQNQAAFDAAMNATGADRVVAFAFPLLVTKADGSAAQIGNNRDLAVAYAGCVPDQGWDRAAQSGDLIPACLLGYVCLEIVYPVSLVDGNDQPYTANDETELIDLIVSIDTLYFTLPLTVIDLSGDRVVINDVGTFFELAFDCDLIDPPVVTGGFQFNGFACNRLAFPFNVQTGNGDIITVDDENEYAALVLNGTEIELLFPFSLIDENDNLIPINNLDDLIEAYKDCGVEIVIEPVDICETPAHALLFFNTALIDCRYSINYPMQLAAGGQVFNINTFIEYFGVYNAYNLNEIDVVYPVSITLLSDGSTVTFNNDQDICTFIDNCQ
ncbi:MAG: hypothetical protein SFV52_15925 [Saprospiraceae bacterium]|nr:hypothetical protein [Saprospiraceae bacterium]